MARKTSEDLRDLVKSIRDRSFPYEKREPERRNWSDYENAQINEVADILESIRDVVDLAASRMPAIRRGVGKPPVPASDIVKVY